MGGISLKGRTWERDTNGLYDYSSKEISDFKTIINNNVNIKRKGKEIFQDDSNQEKQEDIENLFEITKQEKGNYIIENNVETNMEQNETNITKINNKIWYVIHEKNPRYFLTKNDIIKLGRIKYMITEDSIHSGDIKYDIQIPNLESISNINKQNSILGNPFSLIREVKSLSETNNTEEKPQCKICYLEEIEPQINPMIHLCKCKGGLNYAHFGCIKLWMKTKLIIRGNYKKTVKTYFIPKFNCEICKAPYPYKFKLNKNGNQIYELIDIERPNCNYIILESLDQIKENNENHKFIHVIKLINEEDITIGRSNLADIKVNDISVSRIHAKLNFNFNQKSLEIKDLKSKFGTLVLIKDKIELKYGEVLFFQVGRTLFGINNLKKEEGKINEEEAKIDKEIKVEKNDNEMNENNDLEDKDLNEEKPIIENNNQNDNGNENNDNNMEIY